MSPAHVHAHYSLYEALAAFGDFNPGAFRQGVRWLPDEHADLFFVTLRKTERHYSRDDDVPRPCDLADSLPLGISEHDNGAIPHRSAVHHSPRGRLHGSSLSTRK